MERLFDRISISQWRWLIMAGIALITLGSVWFALRMHINALFAIPIAVVAVLQVIYNYKPVFYLLFFCIPWSINVELGALSLDLVTEPLMLVLLTVFIIISKNLQC